MLHQFNIYIYLFDVKQKKFGRMTFLKVDHKQSFYWLNVELNLSNKIQGPFNPFVLKFVIGKIGG